MIQIAISIFLSLFFLGVARMITQNWVAAILVAVFVLIFSFFGLGMTTAASYSDDQEIPVGKARVSKVNSRPTPRLVGFSEPVTTPVHK
jgi:O-antigen ligase